MIGAGLGKEGVTKRRELNIAFTAVFTALAIALHIFQYPFPLAAWLKFDLAGVPIAVLFLVSLKAGLASMPIFWLGCVMLTGDPTRVVGPSMKTVAELATAAPLAIVYGRLSAKGSKELKAYTIAFAVALTCRVLIMLLLNYLIAPHWLVWARLMETFEAAYRFTLTYLPHNALFNAIAVCYVVPLSIATWRSIKRYIV